MSSEELAQRRPVHHVVRDYSYVRKDLVAIAAVTAATFAFIFGASFLN